MTIQDKVYKKTTSASAKTEANTNSKGVKAMKSTNRIEIVVNLALSKGFYEMDDNHHNVIAVHNGRITQRRDNTRLFAIFNPVPAKEGAKCTPVYEVDANGNRTELDREAFWASICGTDDEGFIRTAAINANFEEKTRELKELVACGVKSITFSVDVDKLDQAFAFNGIAEGRNGHGNHIKLSFGPSVSYEFTETVAVADQTFLTGNVVKNAVTTARAVKPSNGISDVNDVFKAAGSSKSARRRAARKAANTPAPAPAPRSMFDSFDAPVAPKAAPQPVGETPAAPQVDMVAMIQQAVAAAVAPLTQEIQSLREELKAKDAEIEALKAASVQPVAAPAPVVEEVTPEPEVVEEAPANEPEVETSPQVEAARESVAPSTPAPQTMDDLFADADELDEEEFGFAIFGEETSPETIVGLSDY